MISWLLSRLRRAIADRRGNVGVIVALSVVPLIGMTGLAADYSVMLSTKAKLDQAADAAALAGVTRAKAYILAYNGLGDPTAAAISAGQAQALSQFNANTGSLPQGTLTAPTINVSRALLAQTLTATVSYSYPMPTYFMSVLGTKTMTVGGTSTTTVTLSTYVNVYVVIDNSASMGIGATAADQTIVYNATGGAKSGCALTCHYANTGSADTVVQAHNAGAQLRIDAAKTAIYAGLKSVLNFQNASNPTYSVAVYTASTTLVQVFPTNGGVSTDFQGAMNAVGNTPSTGIDLSSLNNDGGTDTTNALKSLAKILPASGTGLTALTAQGVVIFVTDGVQDQDKKVSSGSKTITWSDQANKNFTVFSPCQTSYCTYDSAFGLYFEAFDPTQCTPIKNLGYTLMTLNVKYLIPADSVQGGSAAQQAVFDYVQNYLASSIQTNLTSCATSSNYAYTATTPDEIAAATKQMFGAIPAAAQARIAY